MRRWKLSFTHKRSIIKTYRSTNQEKQHRINFAADELAKGKRAMDINKNLPKYNVSIQQARDYVRQAKPVLTESISPNDRAFIFSKVMNCLEQDRLDAKESGESKRTKLDLQEEWLRWLVY